MNKFAIFGAGEHGKVVADCILSNNVNNIVFVDENSQLSNKWINFPIYTDNIIQKIKKSKVIIGIGNNKIRKDIVCKFPSFQFASISHITSFISKFSEIGDGTVAMAFSLVQTNSRIGNHCIINSNASIDHDCIIEDFVHVGPGSILCGNVRVSEGAFIGAGTTIIPSVNIGKWATIGAGSIVLKDVPDFATVVGNPAKIIKINTPNE